MIVKSTEKEKEEELNSPMISSPTSKADVGYNFK